MESSLARLFELDAASQTKVFHFPVQCLFVENEFSVVNDGQAIAFDFQVSPER